MNYKLNVTYVISNNLKKGKYVGFIPGWSEQVFTLNVAQSVFL